MSARVLALLVCSLVFAPLGHAQNDQGFRGILNSDAMRTALSVLRNIASQVVFQWGSAQDSRYGLSLDEDWQQRTKCPPLHLPNHEMPEFSTTCRPAGASA
jgi:hypothetical protein